MIDKIIIILFFIIHVKKFKISDIHVFMFKKKNMCLCKKKFLSDNEANLLKESNKNFLKVL